MELLFKPEPNWKLRAVTTMGLTGPANTNLAKVDFCLESIPDQIGSLLHVLLTTGEQSGSDFDQTVEFTDVKRGLCP